MSVGVPGYEFKVFQPKNKYFAEINAYCVLIEEAYRALHEQYEVFPSGQGRISSEQEFLDIVGDGWLIGLYKEDMLVATITINEDLEEEKKRPNTAVFFLHLVAVSPSMSRQGLGGKLLQYACDFVPLISAGKQTLVRLGAIVEQKLHLFYSKFGFEEYTRESLPCGTWGSQIPFHVSFMQRWLKQ